MKDQILLPPYLLCSQRDNLVSNVPNIQKMDHSKSGHFCPDFKCFLRKWQPFVRISNGRAAGFQIPLKILTICKPTSFQPFEIQTSPDFRSPLVSKYWTWSVFKPSEQVWFTNSLDRELHLSTRHCIWYPDGPPWEYKTL